MFYRDPYSLLTTSKLYDMHLGSVHNGSEPSMARDVEAQQVTISVLPAQLLQGVRGI